MTTCAPCCYAAIDLANARAALTDYNHAFERILTLHACDKRSECTHCKRPWPCPTAKAALQPRPDAP